MGMAAGKTAMTKLSVQVHGFVYRRYAMTEIDVWYERYLFNVVNKPFLLL